MRQTGWTKDAVVEAACEHAAASARETALDCIEGRNRHARFPAPYLYFRDGAPVFGVWIAEGGSARDHRKGGHALLDARTGIVYEEGDELPS